ncbi:MAG: phosphoribosylanthranilate isomerase [Ignavibacteriae bacterium]|nr:phosphoribosylanthranilate isomerase [Ignavibacteriota bacterium]
MKPNFQNFIQVAGVIDKSEADLLLECGVNYLGFPLRLPINKEDLSEKEAAEIINNLVHPNYGIVISYSSTAEKVIELCDKVNSKIIQLHGPININELKKLKSQRSDISIIKSLVIKKDNTEKLTSLLKELDLFVDAFITDTFDPATGASGATGKTHDWEISKNFVKISSKPVILAGGLNPTNVYDAILQVKPAGVDVHTGIENQTGRKDKHLIEQFLGETYRAFKKIGE